MANISAASPTGSPEVSFIVPLYNCLPLTQAMLASLRATLPAGLDYEIVLVDDGSTDGTREWLAAAAPERSRPVLNERNLGYAGANNRGAAAARGAVLVLLNNDLVLERGWWEPLTKGFRRLGPRAGAVGNVQRNAATGAVDHAGIEINHQGKPVHVRRRGWRRGTRIVPAVTGACLMIARGLWEELGGFDEGYRNGCEDVDLCFRAAAQGKVNAVVLGSVVRHHVSASPGRKANDEANTWRLVSRWHETLAELGRRAWMREYFERYLPEPRDYPDKLLARQAALAMFGLKHSPVRAKEGVRANLEMEIRRWRGLGLREPGSRAAR